MKAHRSKLTGRILIHCPGCNHPHSVRVDDSVEKEGPKWGWNNSLERPTFSPSLLVTAPPTPYRCHSFVNEGRIQFLSDCSHALKGQTVDLQDYDWTKGDW